MSGMNTYKEHLLYNEKEQNVKNINTFFEARQLFDPCKNFMGLQHPSPLHQHQSFDSRQYFMNPRHFFFYPRQNIMNSRHPRSHAATLPTPHTLFNRLVLCVVNSLL